MTYVPQAVMLKRSKFTRGEAAHWMRSHGYHPIKEVHVSPEYFHYRLVDPARLAGGRFREIKLGDIGFLTVTYFGGK